jgi:hypothetical protein
LKVNVLETFPVLEGCNAAREMDVSTGTSARTSLPVLVAGGMGGGADEVAMAIKEDMASMLSSSCLSLPILNFRNFIFSCCM